MPNYAQQIKTDGHLLNRPPPKKGRKGAHLKRVRVKQVSDKRRLQGAIYRKRRIEFLGEHPFCEARIPFFKGCAGGSKDVHHSAGRLGGNFLDRSTWVAVCRPCHDFIHSHPREARQLALLK